MATADHARRITAMLNTNGCTPAEAQGRLAKARQIAEREGLLAMFPALHTPEERRDAKAQQAKSAAAHHSARAKAEGARPRAASYAAGDYVDIGGQRFNLHGLGSAQLAVLAELLRREQQRNSARHYDKQREVERRKAAEAVYRKEVAALRARYFRLVRLDLRNLAWVLTWLAVATLMNLQLGGGRPGLAFLFLLTVLCPVWVALQAFVLAVNDRDYVNTLTHRLRMENLYHSR